MVVDRAGTLLLLIWGAVSIAWSAAPPQTHPQAPPAPARHTVDPNLAPWWELATLPRIGRASALRIIEYRESWSAGSNDAGPAFRAPSDLQQVPTVGPKTIQRIGRHLRFGPALSGAGECVRGVEGPGPP
ncbi:MAG: helix-hairpin-helix domain-containing protein [Planctomycetes bacterium]|nr:helix-hairpin-helix domain-containing protein [Planctomycetota bacterium]